MRGCAAQQSMIPHRERRFFEGYSETAFRPPRVKVSLFHNVHRTPARFMPAPERTTSVVLSSSGGYS